jgi:hypothetical protein
MITGFLRHELNSTCIQFIPIVQIKNFETTAPQTWDASQLPMLGSPEAIRIGARLHHSQATVLAIGTRRR